MHHELGRSDAVYRWFQNPGFPLRDTNGHLVRWFMLLTDIDDRKRAEDADRASERNRKIVHRHDSSAMVVGPFRWFRRVLQPFKALGDTAVPEARSIKLFAETERQA